MIAEMGVVGLGSHFLATPSGTLKSPKQVGVAVELYTDPIV